MEKQEIVKALERRRSGKFKHAVILVKQHKTGKSCPSPNPNTSSTVVLSTITGNTGPAGLVCDTDTTKMLSLWIRIVEQLPKTDLAFPEFDGTPLVHLVRKVDHAARALGHILPTATNFRKEVENSNKRIDAPMREAVSRALSHSMATAEQYYQAPMTRDSVQTYRTIQQLSSSSIHRTL